MKLFFIVVLLVQTVVFTNYVYKPSVSRTILARFEDKPVKQLFKVWHLLYNKKYDLSSEEASKRFKIFKENLKNIKEFNERPGELNRQGLGPFTDITDDEFKARFEVHPEIQKKIDNYTKNPSKSTPTSFLPLKDDDNDDDLTNRLLDDCPQSDWRSGLPPVKDQGSSCVSGWAFATATLAEINYYRKKGSIKSFSAQFFVDCDNNDNGCTGGDPMTASIYLEGHAVPTEASYPYTGSVGTCQQPSDTYQIIGSIEAIGTDQVPDYIRNKGILTGMSEPLALKNYQGGMYYESFYPLGRKVHGIVIVGMGCYQSADYYYIVRNSWGSGWGENGYMNYVYKARPTISIPPVIAIYFPNIGIKE